MQGRNDPAYNVEVSFFCQVPHLRWVREVLPKFQIGLIHYADIPSTVSLEKIIILHFLNIGVETY